jgi:hypothetical protein
VALVRNRRLKLINCTLSKYNPSFYDNIKYFNDWRMKNNIMGYDVSIKLNHIIDTDDKYNLHGKLFKRSLALTGKQLDLHIAELSKLAYKFRFITEEDLDYLEYRPYIDFILEYTNRYYFVDEKNPKELCSKFNKKLIDYNFTIDTLGNYTPCELLDSSDEISNKNLVKPEECLTCKYRYIEICNQCGLSKPRKRKCEYYKKLAELLIELRDFDKKIKRIKNGPINSNNCL